jgi:hypothetical protein
VASPEKEKVSITLDKPLVDEIRAKFGGRALSASINELLYAAMAQEHLAELVDEMEQEAGPASPEAYERVLERRSSSAISWLSLRPAPRFVAIFRCRRSGKSPQTLVSDRIRSVGPFWSDDAAVSV